MTKIELVHKFASLQKMFMEIRTLSTQSTVIETCDRGINLVSTLGDELCSDIDKPIDPMM